MGFEAIHLPLIGGPHGPAGAVHHVPWRSRFWPLSLVNSRNPASKMRSMDPAWWRSFLLRCCKDC